MDAAHGPVMITRYRKPGYVIMAADRYEDLVRQGSDERGKSGLSPGDEEMSEVERKDTAADRIALQLFADRLIDREEAEERTGLYLSEMLVLMGELGIKRKTVGAYEGMPEAQKRLFDMVFVA